MSDDADGVSRRGLLAATAGSAAAVAAAGPAGAQEGGNNTTATGTPAGNETADGGAGNQTGNETAGGDGGDGGGGGGTTHDVDMTDSLVFEPAELTIAPGDTVAWTTTGSQPHTATAYEDDIPEDAAYFASGGFDSEDAARSNASAGYVQQGETYEHTFQTTGTFEYFCIPHEGAGMVGTVEVQEGGGGGEDGGANVPAVTDSAKTLGIASVMALVSTLGLAYAFLKWGGDYGQAE